MNPTFLGLLMRRFFVGLFSMCVLTMWARSASAAADTNEVTAASILKDLASDENYTGQIATLLAFEAREDDRPWYVDHALLVLQLPKGKWVLAHAVRNPKFPKGQKRVSRSTEWRLHHVEDAPFVGDRHFDHRPSRKEVDQFLTDNEWQFESDIPMRVVRQVVNEETWQKVLGYKPIIQAPKRRGAALPAILHHAAAIS